VPERHGCLTAILIVFGVLTGIAAIANLAFYDRIAGNLPNAPAWASQGVLVMGTLGLLAVAALVGLWFWQKWALYLYVALALIVFAINVTLVGLFPALLGLVGVALVTIFVARQWQDFR
jgi:hypothetical protein